MTADNTAVHAEDADDDGAVSSNVLRFPSSIESDDETSPEASDIPRQARMIEAILFASHEPVPEKLLAEQMPEGTDTAALLRDVQAAYEGRGVNLVKLGDAWAFRTAEDLSFLLQKQAVDQRKLSRAALEVLAIIAYHQSVTRAEIEDIRGVATSKGTLDVLMETGWVRMRGRRKTPGRPVTYGTTPDFLDHFGLERVQDLPGMDELKGAGLLQSDIPSGFSAMPILGDPDTLDDDEDPLGADDIEELGLLPPTGGD
ncbi:SMC-Scp complex subunit ScpB [Ahrensia sp. R2A130]|uniref:SMC-Scp complex subunit ScpB n=1 Tax=Ahrensia sp. R2A130 TaxID=744979 RepID=UPI0001E0E85A|nr:SMC-Scp complex subunit ScpB [Ahrensia sp. R2A130]EFL90384.1 segregation and condensation protein B [Ahrensia sp. R2A130]